MKNPTQGQWLADLCLPLITLLGILIFLPTIKAECSQLVEILDWQLLQFEKMLSHWYMIR